MKDSRIIFMGTPDFAVYSLKILVNRGYNIVAVITTSDKLSGRGRKLNFSPVKKFCLNNNLKYLQPKSLKDELFINELNLLNADLQVVVAFRKLPKVIWEMPKLGTFNLHASLLPKYRGAAPINWALINGEKETGVTTFLINEEIDTGKILLQKKIKIKDDENAGSIHDKLMIIGSDLICDTIDNFKTIKKKKQSGMPSLAPKIFKNDCKINWNNNIDEIFNKIRGLSPYPSAWCDFLNNKTIKILKSEIELFKHNLKIGQILSDNKTYLKFAAKNGFIKVLELQLEGKRKVSIQEFLRGYKI
tara:strand:- start:789 stop:1697 length:909 start_codon:yes stop_codon:yes gene_type:complete